MKLRSWLSKKRLLACLLAVSGITTLTGWGAAHPLRRAAAFVLAPLGHGPMYAVTHLKRQVAANEGEMSPEQAGRLREENRYLRWMVSQWRYQAELYSRRARELANFQRLYGPIRDLSSELIPANVVAADSLPYAHTRRVRSSAATKAGEYATTRQLLTKRSRLAVVSASALVGRIVEPGAFTARLQLLTDPAFRIQGRIRRIINPRRPRMVTVTRDNLPRTTTLTPENNLPIDDVMVRGDGGRRLIVEHVKAYHNVRPGDLVVTSGRERMIPTEIHVGKVVDVQPDAKDPRRVTVFVQPHADLEALREVYIISPFRTASSGP